MRLNLKKKVAVLGLATLTLSGCATIMSGGSTQTINVQAVDNDSGQPIQGAVCQVSNAKSQMSYVSGNPGTVSVSNGGGALTVACTKKGYIQTRTASGDSFNAWAIGNVIFWPGFIVDAVTGAMTRYPSHITVVMTRAHK
ncbi:MAG: hypothetical protein SFW66_01885 [Gammaproteobacteria bacterium]|nr:hypothetical protein [Gammaproteobacteria bacterium]